jgi:hypothetical protein
MEESIVTTVFGSANNRAEIIGPESGEFLGQKLDQSYGGLTTPIPRAEHYIP